MKTILQWASLCAASFALCFLPARGIAQTVPTIQGTSVADPAVPVLISPAPSGSGFFVLNQDFSLLQHSTVDTSQNDNCPTGPGIFSRTNPAARTLVTDLYNAYMSGPDGSALNTAVDAVTPEVTCTPITAFDYTGGVATQSVAANDPQHALYYLVSAFGGAQVDQLLVLSNLNNATVSSTSKFTELNEAALDTNGVYTSVVADTRSDFGLTAITELKTATSPGNLWIYYPQTNAVYKILGPGGVPLPAVTSFIIPPQTDGGGSLLLLVNQDGLTTSNYLSPPQDTAPFTVIDLGQIRLLMGANSAHNTITLPFVQQIKATTSFYAMLGAAYNPIDHRIYALVAGGTSVTNIVENIISYDTLNPSAPGEIVVADVSNITSSLGTYPQLALNAASGTMQILTSNPAMVYTVGITGTGNSAVALTGSAFSDSSFQPTFIAANPLQGETYIASASGQVDILTRPATKQGGLTITLTGSDLGYTSQEYDLKPLALWPVYDSSLGTAKLTITVTPKGGTPVVLATGHVSDIGYPGSSFYTYMFPAAGQYTIVATADASANYPAVTSPPLNVFVGNKGVYPTAITLSVPATAPSTNGQATLNVTVTLVGTTYAPLNAVYIQDQTGAEVGNVQLPKGAISNPITVPITIGDGVQTLTATYAGDEQNQSSTSAPQVITVGTVTKVTPTFAVTLPSTAVTGASVAGNLKLTSTSTTAPTGTVTIYATPPGSTTANQIATVPAAQAFASAGANFSFTAPAAGTYSVFAGYGGDTNYNNAISSHVSIVITGAPLQVTSVGIVAPATGTAGTAFNTVIGFNVQGAFTTQPTGNIVLTATSAGTATTIGTVTPAQAMAPGGANVSVNLPAAGVYTLNASYGGDSLYAASSNTATITIGSGVLIGTTLSLHTPTPVPDGTPYNAVVTLTPAKASSPAPTGNVILSEAGVGIIATFTATQAFSSGGAVFVVPNNTPGTFTFTASYAGDSNYSAATGVTSTTVVPTVGTTLTVTPASATITPGTAFNAFIALSPATTLSSFPTGNVVLTATYSSGAVTNLATITAAQALAVGGYSAHVSLPNAGTYTLNAIYAGDSNYSAASGSTSITVAGASPQIVIGVNPSVNAPNLTSTVSVSFNVSAPNPSVTGAITFTATSAAGVTTTIGTVIAPTQQNKDFSLATPGVYTITAKYAGDTFYSPATATTTLTIQVSSDTLTITGPATGTVPSSTLTFSLTQANAAAAVTGNAIVTSSCNGSAGPSATVPLTGIPGAIPFGLVFTTPGVCILTATYAGDADNTPATSAPFTITLTAIATPAFTSVLTGTDTINFTSTPPVNSTTFTLTALNGYSTPVNFTFVDDVTNVAPAGFTLSVVNPATGAAVTSATPTSAGLKLQLNATQTPLASLERPFTFKNTGALACTLLFAGCFGIRWRSRAKRMRLLTVLTIVSGGLFLSGCEALGCDSSVTTSTIHMIATPTSTTQGAAPQKIQLTLIYSKL